MKIGCSGTLKPGRLGLICKANECCDARTGGLGVLPTHETPCYLVMPAQLTPGERRHKYKLVSTEQAPILKVNVGDKS